MCKTVICGLGFSNYPNSRDDDDNNCADYKILPIVTKSILSSSTTWYNASSSFLEETDFKASFPTKKQRMAKGTLLRRRAFYYRQGITKSLILLSNLSSDPSREDWNTFLSLSTVCTKCTNRQLTN